MAAENRPKRLFTKNTGLCEEMCIRDRFKTFDIGDIIGVVGRVFKTRTGEISIHAEKVELLSKMCIRDRIWGVSRWTNGPLSLII